MKEYEVISRISGASFEIAILEVCIVVNNYIKSGWVPQGGLTCTTERNNFYFVAQAMVRKVI